MPKKFGPHPGVHPPKGSSAGGEKSDRLYPLGHLGITAALGVHLSGRGYYPLLDFRLLLLGAVLPDLIDKPLALAAGLEGRTIGHSMIFIASLTLVLLMWFLSTPVGSSRRATVGMLTVLAIGAWMHLILDRIWEQPWVFLWPLLGLGPPEYVPGQYLELPLGLQWPYIVFGEAVGLLALVAMALRYRLYRRPNLLRSIRTGVLDEEAPTP